MLAPNTTLQNRYRVVRELGHGGMGTVYEALDQRVNCIVALKETLATRDAEARSAFEREAALLGNLRHQALPKVMDYFSENEGDFLVMEFIPGYDLAELLDLRGSPFPQSQVLRWAHDLLRVLEYLHGQEPPILHRDIKPSNLKLTKQGEVFLLDFGLAKGSVGQMPTLVTSRSVRGYTPVYASLEQIHGHGTDARSDLYSLGATLYHLLTRVAPIDAPARFHAIEEEQTDPLQPIQTLNPQASANVAEVIHQAMAISRKQRPISATEMRKALRNAAEEDERSSAEEEYRHAEATRREREEEKRKAAEEAASRAESEYQLQEAETRKKAEANERAAEELLRAEASAGWKAEQLAARKREAAAAARHQAEEIERLEEDAKRRRANLPRAIQVPPGPTVVPGGSAPPPTERPIPQTAIKTIPALLPERSHTARGDAAFAGGALMQAKAVGSKRVFVIAAGVLAVGIVGAILLWGLRGNSTPDSPSSAETQPEAAQPAKPAEKQPPAGMVYIPGGTFTIGRDDGDEAERPAHQVTVKPIYIDTYEVTNEDYEKFLKATSHRSPPTWKNGSFPSGAARQPVTGVTWDDANDYARWAGKRLPTEEEWEFAARGTDGRIYPWGNDWRQGSANANGAEQGMVPVGSYQGTSSSGVYDMVGNAWEWTASDFRAPQWRTARTGNEGEQKVIRGGSYESSKEFATVRYRVGWPPRGARTYDQTGFRCVKDIAP
ncbi:MAG: SUMF1/EgtB/PvdO family nonheme iron enzyme [Pyrinomonadaceae bacterium]|nr:SUMF1/EgtB/PvdO family nonheme iron enzyme [Pyrinomonadaceae bacterium]